MATSAALALAVLAAWRALPGRERGPGTGSAAEQDGEEPPAAVVAVPRAGPARAAEGGADETATDPEPDLEQRYRGRSRAELEEAYANLAARVSREKRRCFDERFAAGAYEVRSPEQGLLPSPPRTPGGLDVELSWRTVRDGEGRPVIQVTTLPVEQYPELYAAERELAWLRRKLAAEPLER